MWNQSWKLKLARPFSLFSLFDPKLKHRPCRSMSWFISILSDWPFMDFLVLLCSKIGLFGCPHAVLIPCSVNSSKSYRKLQCKLVFQDSELKKRAGLSRYTVLLLPGVTDLRFTYELSRNLWTRVCANIVSSEVDNHRGEMGKVTRA